MGGEAEGGAAEPEGEEEEEAMEFFVGELPDEVSEEDLADYFLQFGEVTSAHIARRPRKKSEEEIVKAKWQDKPFAFVKLRLLCGPDEVLTTEHELLGQSVKVNMRTPSKRKACEKAGGQPMRK